MKDFKKYYRIAATPEEIYTALTNPLTLELWTGETALMSTEPGSEFSLWEGSIVGKNIEFEQENNQLRAQLNSLLDEKHLEMMKIPLGHKLKIMKRIKDIRKD